MCIRVDKSHRSHFFTSNVGVRLGDAISPILFNLYVSDFQSYIGLDFDAPRLNTSLVNCLMYADDLVLMSQTEIGLQGLIDKLSFLFCFDSCLTSRLTIFQSCCDGATYSWVLPVLLGSKCLFLKETTHRPGRGSNPGLPIGVRRLNHLASALPRQTK